MFVSIIEAAFQAQLISCGHFKVLPEVTKVLQNHPQMGEFHREQTVETPNLKFWDVVCAVPSCFKPKRCKNDAAVKEGSSLTVLVVQFSLCF